MLGEAGRRWSCKLPPRTSPTEEQMHLISFRRAGTLAAALIFATVCSQRLSAQTGSLQGRITDSTGASVVGTTITVANTALRTAPTARGVYTLNGVQIGRASCRERV